jgi:glutathione S-transferase
VKLYDTQRSGNAWKVRLLAGYLGRPLERQTLSIDHGDLRAERFTRIAPFRQVPVLQLDDGSFLAESTAILHYLAQASAWWPSGALDQSRVLMWMSFEQERHMKPLAQLRLNIALHRRMSVDSPQAREWTVQAVGALSVLEDQLRLQGPSGWVATQRDPSIADVALYPYTRMAPMGAIDLGKFPLIESWLARLEALPGYAPLFPGRPDLNLSTKETNR